MMMRMGVGVDVYKYRISIQIQSGNMTKNWRRRKNFFEFVKLNGNKVCSHTRTSNSIAASFAILGVQKEYGDNCVHPNDKLSISTQINDVCSLMDEHGHRTDIV